jgi:hypothetical protein
MQGCNMTTRLPQTGLRDAKWVDIDLSAGQTLRLKVDPPNFSQQVHSLLAESPSDFWERRIRASVTGWEGVVDDADQPVPFSWDMLEALLVTYPQALALVQAAVIEVWVTYPEDLEKKSPAPPASGGTETPTEIAPATDSSSSATS